MLTLNQHYHQHTVRTTFADDGTPVIILADVAKVLGVSRYTLRKIVEENADLLEGYRGNVTLPLWQTRRGKTFKRNEVHICVTKEGLVAILLKIAPKRVKRPEARQAVLQFQKWAVSTLTALLKHQNRLRLRIEQPIPPAGLPDEVADLVREVALNWNKPGNGERVKRLQGLLGCSEAAAFRYVRNPALLSPEHNRRRGRPTLAAWKAIHRVNGPAGEEAPHGVTPPAPGVSPSPADLPVEVN